MPDVTPPDAASPTSESGHTTYGFRVVTDEPAPTKPTPAQKTAAPTQDAGGAK